MTGSGRSRSLLVNYLSLLGGTIGAKALGLVTVLMLTRYLGVSGFGQYSLIFSFWALLNTLVDFGGVSILGRELARNPADARRAVESACYLRLLGCLLFLPAGFFLGRYLGLDADMLWLAFLGILAGFEAFYDAWFSARMHLDNSARARLYSSMGNVALLAVAVACKLPLAAVILIAMLNPLLKLGFDYIYSPFRLALHAPHWPAIARMALDGWPLWLMGIQYILLARIDTFMLQKLSPTGGHDLGIYSAAFRFSEVMALLINALCPAMLPLLVRYLNDVPRLRFLAGTSMRLILAILMVMSLFVFWYAPWITHLYGAGYEESATCMRILIWSQALVAINTVCYQMLVIYNHQGRRPVLIASVGMTLLNVGLNFWLIPTLHAEGASWATVITEFAIVLSMLWFLRHYTPLRLGRDVLVMELLAVAASIPGFLLGWRLGGALSILIFAVLVSALRLLTPADLKTLAEERLHEDLPPSVPSDIPDLG